MPPKKKSSGRRKTSTPKKRASAPRRARAAPQYDDPYGLGGPLGPMGPPGLQGESPLSGILGTMGPMALSYAIKKGTEKYKSFKDNRARAKQADAVRKDINFLKAPKSVQDAIIVMILQGANPYTILGVKSTDSQIYVSYAHKKAKLFGRLSALQKTILDAALAYIKIQKSLKM